jgi:glucose-6-phosphate isomerase
MSIRIDYSNMLATNVPGAIDDATWNAAGDRFAEARQVFAARRSAGELGFLDLVEGHDSITELRRFADGVGQAFNDVVVLGIGGSALGTVALRSALRSTRWNELDDEAREFFPRLHVLDNVDPTTIAPLLDRLDLGSTLFIVISKSGSTAETMAQYLIVRGRLEAALPDGLQRHLVFITDPERGALRSLAQSEGIVSLDVPTNVGGRYSVLSPVGLLPGALMGIDVPNLLAGARDMAARCELDAIEKNPAGVFSMLQWLADTRLGMGIQVLMPYSDPLADMGDWFVQLWAESLGKLRDGRESVGPTPMAAVGATDQHSKVQLFMEGPRDKTVTFVAVGELERDVELPHLHTDIPELAYLGGHRLGELLEVERKATAGALAAHGRPNMTIMLDRVDEWHVGGLIILLETAAIYSGALYGVNPLDQPGVELGKHFTYGMLGRPDAEEARRQWQDLPSPDPRRIV